MGRKSSIDPETGARLLEAYGRLGSKSAAAREIGVSEDAADRYLKDTPKAAAPVVAQQRQIVEVAGASLFNSTAALEENYRKVVALIDKLEAGIIEVKTSAAGEKYETLVSPAILVSALREAREYVTAATRLLELMISVEENRKFHDAVLQAIGEADAPTKQRIIEILRQQRALGLALSGG